MLGCFDDGSDKKNVTIGIKVNSDKVQPVKDDMKKDKEET